MRLAVSLLQLLRPDLAQQPVETWQQRHHLIGKIDGIQQLVTFAEISSISSSYQMEKLLVVIKQ